MYTTTLKLQWDMSKAREGQVMQGKLYLDI
jgi:hypothetical protein